MTRVDLEDVKAHQEWERKLARQKWWALFWAIVTGIAWLVWGWWPR